MQRFFSIMLLLIVSSVHIAFAEPNTCNAVQATVTSAAIPANQPYVLTDAEKKTLDAQVENSLKMQQALLEFMNPLIKSFLVKMYNEKYEKLHELSDNEFALLKDEINKALDTFVKENEEAVAQKAAEIYGMADGMQRAYFLYSFKKSFAISTKNQVINNLELQRTVYKEVKQNKEKQEKKVS